MREGRASGTTDKGEGATIRSPPPLPRSFWPSRSPTLPYLSVSSCRERIENMLSHLLGGRGGRGCERGSVKSRSPASKRDGNLEDGAPSSDLLRGTSSAAVACSTATQMVTGVQQTKQTNKRIERTTKQSRDEAREEERLPRKKTTIVVKGGIRNRHLLTVRS